MCFRFFIEEFPIKKFNINLLFTLDISLLYRGKKEGCALDRENKKLSAGQNEWYEKKPEESCESVMPGGSHESGAFARAGEQKETEKAGRNAEKIEEEENEGIKETDAVGKIGEASESEALEIETTKREAVEIEEEEDDASFPARRRSLLFKLTALFVIIIFTTLALGSFLKIFSLPALDFLVESQELSRDPLVRELKRAVVRITAFSGGQGDPFSKQLRGTGFNISPEGLIVTNRHLVEDAASLTVSFSGGEKCRIAGWWIDPDADLALITLVEGDFPFLELEKEMLPQTGEQVMIIGNPLSFPRVVIQGKITGYRELNPDHFPQPVLEIDASIYGGSSGSPVFNKEGKVVAIIYAAMEGQEEEDTRGLALPVTLLEDFIVSTENNKEDAP